MNAPTRAVTVFSAGCPICEETLAHIRALACPSCDLEVVDVHDPSGAERARSLGVGAVPAVAIDGELVSCCGAGGPDMATLQEAGLGRPLA